MEWEGACIQGTCRECITSLAPTLPNALCEDGRSCYRGEEVIAHVGVYSFSYAKDMPLFFGFYVVIATLIITCPIIGIIILVIAYYYVIAKRAAAKENREVHFWYDWLLEFVLW